MLSLVCMLTTLHSHPLMQRLASWQLVGWILLRALPDNSSRGVKCVLSIHGSDRTDEYRTGTLLHVLCSLGLTRIL